MSGNTRNIAVVATPTSPLLSPLLHALSHESGLSVTVLTRETSIKINSPSAHALDHGQENGTSNGHKYSSEITHVQTSFSETDLRNQLQGVDTVICVFHGSDIHLQAPLIDVASSLPNIKLFLPSEYGLDTSNAKIRGILPPYRTRFEVQEMLNKTSLNWKAVYSGICLEEAMKSDGVLGIDVLWCSVVVFPGAETKIAISSTKDIAKQIVDAVLNDTEGHEVWKAGFRADLHEIVKVVEKELDKEIDKYEGLLDGARKEAKERMNMGYFDGGVALMGRVAVWDRSVGAWEGWGEVVGNKEGREEWEEEIKKVVKSVREGGIGGDGCGC